MCKRIALILIVLILFLEISGCADKGNKIIDKPVLEGIEFAGEAKAFDIHVVYFRSINMEYINDSSLPSMAPNPEDFEDILDVPVFQRPKVTERK